MPIDDLPAPSGKVTVSGISDLPAPKKELSFPEKAEGFVYGLGTSIPGMLGDIESVLPGGPEVGARGKGALAGKETVFPTTENVREALTKMGLPPPPGQDVKKYITYGEIAPLVVGGGKALYEGGKAAVQAGKLFGEKMSLGKTARELAEQLRTSGTKTAGEVAKTAGEEMTAAEQRAAIAGKAGEKAERGAELSLRPLPGVTTAEEAGRFKPIAQTSQDIGQRIKQSANQVMERLKADRNARAEVNKQAAFGEAFQKEAAGQNVTQTKAYGDTLKEIDSMIRNPSTGLSETPVGEIETQLRKIRGMLDRTIVDADGTVISRSPPSFAGLEEARRFLRDRSFGVPAEGYDAISQQMAKRLADRIEDIQKEFSPGIDKFLRQYAKDSQPLNVFSTKMGKALTGEQLPGKGANYATVAAQDIPGQAFRSKESFDALVDALGGNRQLAQADAKRYFASKLESLGDSKAVEDFIRKNKAMLNETGSTKMADKYAIDLRNFEKRGAAAGKISKEEAAVAEKKAKAVQDFQTFQSDLEVAGNDAAKISAVSNNMAKKLLSDGYINQFEYRDLQRQIEKVRMTTRDANEMKNQIKVFVYRAFGYGAGATAAGYGAMKAFE